MRLILVLALLAAPHAPGASRTASIEAGRRQLAASCTRCHPLQVIRLRRFPREDWDRVLDKMQELGARIRNRQALLDYLVANYGEAQPPGSAKR